MMQLDAVSDEGPLARMIDTIGPNAHAILIAYRIETGGRNPFTFKSMDGGSVGYYLSEHFMEFAGNANRRGVPFGVQ